MSSYQLDDVDKELLALLQENARYAATELAERVGVSDNTVHNRIQRLEEAGVITGYSTALDFDRMGLDLYYQFACTVRISDRGEVAEQVRAIPAVVRVTELMTGQRNLLVTAVAREDDEITRVAERVDELDVEINDENLIRAEHTSPLNYPAIEAMFDADD